MSTKIYNAFIFNGNTEELMSILKDIKSEYYEFIKNKLTKLNYSKWILEKKRYKFLEQDYTWQEFKNTDFPEYVLEDIISVENKRGEWHPFNIEASAVVYHCENKVYVQFFGFDRDFQKIQLDKYNQFQDYHYQNSTDMSNYDWDNEPWDTMSDQRKAELEAEWEERCRIWEKIMPDWSIPSECGLVYNFEPIGYKLNCLCNDILNSIE